MSPIETDTSKKLLTEETEQSHPPIGTAVITPTSEGTYQLIVGMQDKINIPDPRYFPEEFKKLQEEGKIGRIHGVGIPPGCNDEVRDLVWKELDIVPVLLPFPIKTPEDIMKAETLVRESFTKEGAPIIDCDPKTGEVTSSPIATLSGWEKSYKEMGKEDFWKQTMAEIDQFAKELNGVPVIRINTTAQAGGVAGMLHPANRFIAEYNKRQKEKGADGHPINFHWHTMNGYIDPAIAEKYEVDLKDPSLLEQYGNPEKPDEGINVFKITKKMHNIIQGQELEGEEFTETDKKIHAAWSESQAKRMQDVLNQPDAVYWIDDQQPLGLIKRIRENNPNAKIIFRFHIQVRNDLVHEGSQQKNVIDFLMDKMTGPNAIDAFLSHRSTDEKMDEFLPKDEDGNIDPRIARKVMFKVATADTEDGFGKELTPEQRNYYLEQIDNYLKKSDQSPLNRKVGHIGQFARFDRAKNIPGVLGSYEQFVKKMTKNGTKLEDLPELIVAGFGAVDDPDGESILADTMRSITEKYPELKEKIKVIRLTYDTFDDRHMKALEDTCDIGLQLSTAEGCEDKITQMLHIGKPMIVANVGGMPPQIIDDENGKRNGRLVEPDDYDTISNHLMEYYTQIYPDLTKREEVAENARRTVNREYTTLANIRDMLGIAALVANHRNVIPELIANQQEKQGRIPFVKEVVEEYFQKKNDFTLAV